MPGPGTTFIGGPMQSGTVPYPGYVAGQLADVGESSLSQTFTLTQNGATAVTQQFAVPQGSQIIDFIIDTTVVWNSGTSATLSVGTAAAGTQYVSGVNVLTPLGRQRPTYTAAQLTAMSNVGANVNVFITVTCVGTAATTGTVIVTCIYDQNVTLTLGPG